VKRSSSPKPRLSEGTARVVFLLSDGFCACGCGRPATEYHHIFSQSKHRNLVDVSDNIVPVAARCHSRHTNAVERFPRSICVRAEGLATTPAMENYLDRVYGVVSADG